MAFYQYRQNNSGGRFDIDEADGITVNVIIEADSAEDADSRAEDIGIYFDGCDGGRDCPCCGDRWYSTCESDAKAEPCVYSQPAAEATGWQWAPDGKETCVHYKDGRKEWFGIAKESIQ
jgi:hypothetical protein